MLCVHNATAYQEQPPRSSLPTFAGSEALPAQFEPLKEARQRE
jgi:hypothetical protein